MSWYISWLRAAKKNEPAKVIREQAGLRRLLKRSEVSLIISEWLFGAGVLFFMIALFHLFSNMKS